MTSTPAPDNRPFDARAVQQRREELLERAAATIAAGPFAPEWPSLQQKAVPRWYSDAKFGIFIHWLVSSVPAFNNEWYARNMYLEGTPEFDHHVATYGPHRAFGYKDFIPDFTAEHFDADEWMSVIKSSGAQYVVPVAEHHDGFALYESAINRWNAVDMGPRRDLIAELAAAARRRGITFGLSNHHAENWWFFNGGSRFDSDVRDPANADLYGPAAPKQTQPDRRFLDDWLARLVELIEQYSPDLVWFDWWIEEPAFEPYLRKFAAYYYNAGVLAGDEPAINYKWEAFAEGSAVFDVERGSVRGIQPAFFQNDTSTSRLSWCHIEGNDFKSASDIVGELIDVVSKNGSLLLNIGPRPDGTIPDEEKQLLADVGSWMSVNGSAIYGTSPWVVYGEGPTFPPTGSFTDTEAIGWTESDVRYTTNDGVVFASFFLWPESETVTLGTFSTDLRLVDGSVTGVRMLGYSGAVSYVVDGRGLVIDLPGARPNAISPVFAITVTPPPALERHEPEMPQ